MSKLRVLVVDDHGIVRSGVRSLIDSQPDMEVVGEATRGEEAVEKARELRPELIIMDITMPGMNGIEATRQIKKDYPETNILALTIHDDSEFFFPVLRAGASGYVLKEAEPEELLSAIHMVSEGQVYLSPSVTKALLESVVSASANSEDEKYSSLTRREKDVLKLAVSGRTNRDIAEALFLSIRTVEKYRQGMMRKLDLGSREDLEKYARRKGILDSQS